MVILLKLWCLMSFEIWFSLDVVLLFWVVMILILFMVWVVGFVEVLMFCGCEWNEKFYLNFFLFEGVKISLIILLLFVFNEDVILRFFSCLNVSVDIFFVLVVILIVCKISLIYNGVGYNGCWRMVCLLMSVCYFWLCGLMVKMVWCCVVWVMLNFEKVIKIGLGLIIGIVLVIWFCVCIGFGCFMIKLKFS